MFYSFQAGLPYCQQVSEMESATFNFCSTSDTKTSNSEIFTPSMGGPSEGVFSPLQDAQFQARSGSGAGAGAGGNANLIHLLSQQEPRQGDTAPTPAEVDFMNFRMNSTLGSSLLFDDVGQSSQSNHNFYTGSSRAESVHSSSNMWSEGSGVSASRNGEMIDTFDFLVKSLSSANNYVSMLTREQLSVLRSIRPSLLYEFLQEVAKVRGDKRMRRALPNECAFCKNNGENEDCYAGHVLKDWRGRVQCPVLRAFRCPRCGATGDRAHTIKYCPENLDNNVGSAAGGLSSRRRGGSAPLASLLLPQELQSLDLRSPHPGASTSTPSTAPPTPAPSPAPSRPTYSTLWE